MLLKHDGGCAPLFTFLSNEGLPTVLHVDCFLTFVHPSHCLLEFGSRGTSDPGVYPATQHH